MEQIEEIQNFEHSIGLNDLDCFMDENKLVSFESPDQKINESNKNNTIDFKTFLETNLETIIKCPLNKTTLANPIIASDGYIYELSAINLMKKYSHYGFTSPITRENLDSELIKIPLIKKIINYADKHNLEISKEKHIIEETYDDIFQDICSIFKNENYNQIYNIDKFILDHVDSKGISLIYNILTIKTTPNLNYFNALCHVFNNCKNIDININGMNVLHIISKHTIFPDLITFIINLIKTKFNLDIESFNVNDIYNKTPIDYMIARNNNEFINLAFKSDININSQLVKYVNILVQTCNDTDIIIEYINKLDNKNEFHNTTSPLFTAIKFKKNNIINYLLDKGVDIEERNSDNINAINYAIQCGDSDIAINFINRASNLEEEIYDGWKLIHMACYYSNVVIINYLLEQNVSIIDRIKSFKGGASDYLPINLIELNNKIKENDMIVLIDYMIQLMAIQKL